MSELIAKMKRDIYTTPNRSRGTCIEFAYLTDTYIDPFFGRMDVRDIKKNWERFKTRVKHERPGMGFEHLRKALSRILHYAVEQELLDGVPPLTLTRDERSFHKPKAYEPDDVDLIFTADVSALGFKQRTIQKIRLMNQLTLETGLRPPSEINNLRMSYFDFENLTLQLPKGFIKTREARTISISKDLATEVLRFVKARRIKSDFIFPMRGNPNQPARSSDRSWQRFKSALGIENTRYEMRHSHATARIAAGESPLQVAVDMGTSVELLEGVYVRPSKERGTEVAERVKKKYGGVK